MEIQRIYMSEDGPSQSTALSLLNTRYAGDNNPLSRDAMRKGLLPNGDSLITYVVKEDEIIVGVARIVQPCGQPYLPIKLLMFVTKEANQRIPMLQYVIGYLQTQYHGWKIEVPSDSVGPMERLALCRMDGAEPVESIQIPPLVSPP